MTIQIIAVFHLPHHPPPGKYKIRDAGLKEVKILYMLFLVIVMYWQASSSQIFQSLNLYRCWLAGKEA